MVFDVTLLVGQNSMLEYNSNGEIIESSPGTLFTYMVPDDRVGKLTVIKDPLINHINLYSLELYDLPMDIISAFKTNSISAIIVRLGTGMSKDTKVFDLHKLYIKPVTILEHALQDKILNDIIVKGISLTANAIIMDSAFGGELKIPDLEENQITVKTNTSMSSYGVVGVKTAGRNSKKGERYADVDMTTVAPVDRPGANFNKNVAHYNPGNLMAQVKNSAGVWVPTKNTWDGEITGPDDKIEKFATPELGFAALVSNVVFKGNKTLKELLTIWAPPKNAYGEYENDTNSYINYVAKIMKISPDQPVPRDQLANLAKAISWYEGDNTHKFFTDEMINRGVAMAGFSDVKVTISDELNKGKFKSLENVGIRQEGGTNAGMPANMFKFIKGSSLLEALMNRMKDKYKIEIDVPSMSTMIKSSFIYKDVNLPGVTTFELIDKIHSDYSPYYMKVPWILDDMKKSKDPLKIGKTWYTEIGLLSLNSFPSKSIWDEAYTNSKTAIYSFMQVIGTSMFYKETRDRVDAKNYIFKDLTTGVETKIAATSSLEIATIPIPEATTKNTETLSKTKINSNKNVIVEAAFDAVEFKKRLDIFKNHVYANPQILKTIIKSDDINFIEFGYTYTFNGNQLNKVTPLKIKMEFENKNNQYQLTYEVDFYKGIDISQA